jgi:hypothetical protein
MLIWISKVLAKWNVDDMDVKQDQLMEIHVEMEDSVDEFDIRWVRKDLLKMMVLDL